MIVRSCNSFRFRFNFIFFDSETSQVVLCTLSHIERYIKFLLVMLRMICRFRYYQSGYKFPHLEQYFLFLICIVASLEKLRTNKLESLGVKTWAAVFFKSFPYVILMVPKVEKYQHNYISSYGDCYLDPW